MKLNVNKSFNLFSLHTMRAIRKCAIKYFLAKAVKMTKRVVLHRLNCTKQEIFESLMFNTANWFKVALNHYEKKSIDDDILEKYKIDDFESFLKRKDEFIKFAQFTNWQSRYFYRVFELKLKDLFTSFTTSRKSSSKQSSENIIDEDIIDEDIIDEDIIDEDIIDEDIIDENIIDKDIVTSKNIIDKDTATSKEIIDKDAIIDKNVTINKDVIIDKNIIINKDVIDKNVIIENDDIIHKKIITSKDIIEKNAIKKFNTIRAKHFEHD